MTVVPVVRLAMVTSLVVIAPIALATQVMATQDQEFVAEIRFHGNHTIPDEELLEMAGVSAGDRLTDATFEQIEQRLKDGGQGASVEILKRSRSFTRTVQVVLIVTVHERISVTQKFMFMPILFTFLFITFPAGLVLYWTVNNLLTIAQQYYIYHRAKD